MAPSPTNLLNPPRRCVRTAVESHRMGTVKVSALFTCLGTLAWSPGRVVTGAIPVAGPRARSSVAAGLERGDLPFDVATNAAPRALILLGPTVPAGCLATRSADGYAVLVTRRTARIVTHQLDAAGYLSAVVSLTRGNVPVEFKGPGCKPWAIVHVLESDT